MFFCRNRESIKEDGMKRISKLRHEVNKADFLKSQNHPKSFNIKKTSEMDTHFFRRFESLLRTIWLFGDHTILNVLFKLIKTLCSVKHKTPKDSFYVITVCWDIMPNYHLFPLLSSFLHLLSVRQPLLLPMPWMKIIYMFK